MTDTLNEIIVLTDFLFPSKIQMEDWPIGAKNFQASMFILFSGMIIGSRMKNEQLETLIQLVKETHAKD